MQKCGRVADIRQMDNYTDNKEWVVLIVEDSPVLRRMLEVTVEPLGVAVDHAISVREAKQQIARREPDIILLDLGLPDGSGTDVLDWLADEGLDDVRVVVASGVSDWDVVERALDAGGVGYLRKPYKPQDVRDLVSRLISIGQRASA